MVVRVWAGLRVLLPQILGQLGPEAELVDLVLERMLDRALPVVLQVVDVHVSVAEAATRRKVEVTDDLVHADSAGDPAALMSLLVKLLGVVFPLALLDTLALSKGPRGLRVRLPNFVASITATGFLGIRRWGCTITLATVIGVEMDGALSLLVSRVVCPLGSISPVTKLNPYLQS